MKSKLFSKNQYIRFFIFIIWIIVWALAAYLVGSELILPSPYAAFRALAKLASTKDFYINVSHTIIRTALGIIISFFSGAIMAAASYNNRPVREFLRLPVIFFKSIPVMAIIIYVILVVRADWVAVVVCFLMCFPIAYTNIYNGIVSLDVERIELGRSLHLSNAQMIKYIIIPSMGGHISSSLSLIASMSWKVVVASEVLAIPRHSIGYQMLNSKYYLETPDLFAYIIVLLILSLLMEKAVSKIFVLRPSSIGRSLMRESVKARRIIRDPEAEVKPAIRLNSVNKSFETEEGSKVNVLEDFSLKIDEGVTAILAPSGSGKTTLARLISGMDDPDGGNVSIEERSRIGYLFQEDRLLPWLNVKENMALALISGNARNKEAEDAVIDIAEKLEISEALNMMPDELSGGMAHRVALGRTLLYNGNILILDEPFRGLDGELRERIIRNILPELRSVKESKITILITHNEDLARELSDRIVRIQNRSAVS